MARTEEQDLQMSEKIGEAGDNQNLEYATPVPKLESGLADDPDAIIEEEPELHSRTYLAVIALFFLNFVQVYALTGPPAIVSPQHGAALRFLNGTLS